MNKFESFLPYLSLTVLSLLLLYVSGSLISGFFQQRSDTAYQPENKWIALFRNLLASVTFFTVLLAILKTKGNTVLILSLPLLLFYFWHNRPAFSLKLMKAKFLNELRICYSPEFLFLAGFALILGYDSFQDAYIPGFGLYSYGGDINFYTRVSSFISFSGIENSGINSLVKGANTYHFFELWFNALLTGISGLKSHFVFLISAIPLLSTVLLAGICALLYQLNFLNLSNRPVLIVLVALALYKFNGFYIEELGGIHEVFKNLKTFKMPFYVSKLLPATLFLVEAARAYVNNDKTKSFLIFLFIPCLTIATAPGVFSASFLFLFLTAIFSKQKKYYAGLVFLLGYIFLFGLFFVFNGQLNKIEGVSAYSSTLSAGTLVSNFTNTLYLRTWINIIAGTTISLPFLFLPVIALVFFRISNLWGFYTKWKDLINLYLLVYIMALATWATLHRLLDATQMFQIIFIPATFILLLLFIDFVYKSVSQSASRNAAFYAKRIAIILIICFPFIRSHYQGLKKEEKRPPIQYSPGYLKNIGSYFDSKPASEIKQGVILTDAAKIKDFYAKNLNVQWPGATYLPTFSNRILLTSLSVMDIPRTKDKATEAFNAEDSYIKSSPFFFYCLKNNFLDTYEADRDAAKLAYIKDHPDLDFVIIDEGLKRLLAKLQYKAVYQDPQSQQVFLVMK